MKSADLRRLHVAVSDECGAAFANMLKDGDLLNLGRKIWWTKADEFGDDDEKS